MTTQEKTVLIKWVRNGHVQKAIDRLSVIKRNESLDKEAIAIASRYVRLKQKNRLGVLSSEQLNITENQITTHLIELINHPENEIFPNEKSIDTTRTTRPVLWKYITIAVVVIVVSVGFAVGLNIINSIPLDEPLQLTVFVTDTAGNVALELEGEINIALGNRSLNKVIGENGRTNFSDITTDNKGDTIHIGIKAKGWEVKGKNTFIFTGEPITIKVKKDSSLGIIKGRVTNRNGQESIAGAEVIINTDTIVFTDARGVFKIVLPEKMRIEKTADNYRLTISKTGYKTETQYHSPKSSDAEIRLEKEE